MIHKHIGPFDGVIFDLYGTLLQVQDQRHPYRNLFGALHVDAKHAKQFVMRHNLGSLSSVASALAPGNHIKIQPYETDLAAELSSVTLYSETIDVLKQLKEWGKPVGLISNLATPYKKPFFDHGLEKYFDAVLFSCDEGMVKPEKTLYEKMADALGLAKDHIIMCGNSKINDFQAPRWNGIQAMYLDRDNTSGISFSTCSLRNLLLYINKD